MKSKSALLLSLPLLVTALSGCQTVSKTYQDVFDGGNNAAPVAATSRAAPLVVPPDYASAFSGRCSRAGRATVLGGKMC